MEAQQILELLNGSIASIVELGAMIETEKARCDEVWRQLEASATPAMVKSLVALLNSPNQGIRERVEIVLGPRLGMRAVEFGEDPYLPSYSDFTRELVLACEVVLANPDADADFRRRCARVLVKRYFWVEYSQKASSLLANTGLNDKFITRLAQDTDPKIRDTVRNESLFYQSMRTRDRVLEETGRLLIPGQPPVLLE